MSTGVGTLSPAKIRPLCTKITSSSLMSVEYVPDAPIGDRQIYPGVSQFSSNSDR